MSLYKRRLTQLDGKMGPALRVAYMDVGKGRENGCGSFTPEKAPLCVACRDASQGREQDAVSFARYSFGTTTKTSGTFLRVSPEGVRHRDVSNKQRASRLAYRDVGKGREQGCGSFDWHFFRGNSNNFISVHRPWHNE